MKSKIVTNDKASGYYLRFRNGQEWVLEGHGTKVKLWLEEFARIIGLNNGHANSCPKLIFYQRKTPKRHLPKNKWQLHDLGVLRYWKHTRSPDIICELSNLGISQTYNNIMMALTLNFLYHRVVEAGGLPVHGGLIAKDARGILLIGPSGIGKSTCSQRIPRPWNALCDDGSLIVRDGEGKYFAHPLPTWSNFSLKRGKQTWNVQRGYSLHAIFFLKKSKSDELIPVDTAMSLACVNKSSLEVCLEGCKYLNPAETRVFKENLFDNCCKLVKSVPAYILKTGRAGKFWELIEEVI